MITVPMLQPKKGYVEVEIDGVRTYRNVETGVLIEEEVPATALDDRVTGLEETTMQQGEILAILLSSDTGEASE